MVQVKGWKFKVICEGCNTLRYAIFLTNRDKHKCDICGRVYGKVRYETIKEGG